MFIVSLILVLLGIACFVGAHLNVPRRWANIALGLALVWSGLVVEMVVRTENLRITID